MRGLMDQTLTYFPGQLATLFLDVKDADGYRANSLTIPEVSQIIKLALSDGYVALDGYLGTDGYAKPLEQIATGLYFVQLTLPATAASVGSYLVDIVYTDPVTTYPAVRSYQIIITAPFGNYSVTTWAG